MASQQASVLNRIRRKADTWDRIKFLVILAIITLAVVGSQVQPPFVTLGQALADFFASTPGRIVGVLFLFEVLRQIHYFISERSERYHGFWQRGVAGGLEGGLSHFKPWTRFRVGRLIRWSIFLLIYAVIADYFMSDISSPIQALGETPRIIVAALPFLMQLFIGISFVVIQFVALFGFSLVAEWTFSSPKRSTLVSPMCGAKTMSSA